ncbi:hypothetical protein [Selenomonas sp.]|uniref:hypothetical protein n=1 Tax=Selenomonas sp. TaxID=2053611 RepID=UPI002A752214|nr:hypothetical protein [Selenomonas sp.]MDY3298109.1 hypothetical protein [Selenomonas sp.]
MLFRIIVKEARDFNPVFLQDFQVMLAAVPRAKHHDRFIRRPELFQNLRRLVFCPFEPI